MGAPPATAPASAPAAIGQPITTEINPGTMVTYKSATHDIKAYLVTPKLPEGSPPAPTVIVVHDIFGMTPFIKAQADNLAKQGYRAMVPNLYSRLDKTDDTLDANAAWLAYDKTSDQQVAQDLSAAIDYLLPATPEDKPAPFRPLGVVGYDMGGIYAMMLAASDLRITAAVNYYGRILYHNTSPSRPASPVESVFNLRAPLLSFYGAIDPQVPASHLEALESRLSHNLSKTFYETIVFPNVGHSFLVPTRPGYNKEASEKALEKTRVFLAAHLRAAPPKSEE
jgi:carboxymethylenebutenolidase